MQTESDTCVAEPGEIKFHRFANIFPLLSDREMRALADDIAENGQKQPAYEYEGEIVDGRNRVLACQLINVEPWIEQYEGDPDELLQFVISLNLHRRHLDTSQRAMAAAAIAIFLEGENGQFSENQKDTVSTSTSGDNDLGKLDRAQYCAPSDTDVTIAIESEQKNGSAKSQKPVTIEQAAELLNVSERTVDNAKKVLEQGTPELIEAVQAGEVTVADAVKVSGKSKSTQTRAVRAKRTGKSKTVSEAAEKLEPELPSDEPAQIKDASGKVVPDKYAAIFATRPEFAKVGRQVDSLKHEIEALAESPAGFYLRKELQSIVNSLKDVKYKVTHTGPHAVAAKKKNEPKWVSQIVWQGLSDEDRAG